MTMPDHDLPGTAVVSLVRATERVTDRIIRLRLEAKVLATENAADLAANLRAMAARALAIADGGDAYPPGIRDLAARQWLQTPRGRLPSQYKLFCAQLARVAADRPRQLRSSWRVEHWVVAEPPL